MSIPFFDSVDFLAVGELENARIHNLATVARTGLSAGLSAANAGLIVYDTDLDTLFTWDGAQWNAVSTPAIDGDVIFKGTVDASTSLDAQAEAVKGYQYLVSVGGNAAMTGITFSPSDEVEPGDIILFTSAATAAVIERNNVPATEIVEGNVRLATQAEANAGTVDDAAITPKTLAGALKANSIAKAHFETVSLAALTPKTITHGLGLVNKDAFTINTMKGGQQVNVRVDSVDANSLTLTSILAQTGVAVTVIGAADPA